jgi:hypothetical protein
MREHDVVAIQNDSFLESDSLEDRSLKELVSGLGRDMGLLVRQEMQLAKAEVSEKVSNVTKGAAKIGAGAFVAYAGVLALTAALVLLAITIGITPWLSAAIIAVLFLLAGFLLIQSGRRSMKAGPAPLERTKQTSKQTVRHLKEQLR